MATLTIRNLPDDLYDRLKKRASANRRSVNGETIVCLEEVLLAQPVDESRLRLRVRRLRESQDVYVTDETIRAAIDEGRQ